MILDVKDEIEAGRARTTLSSGTSPFGTLGRSADRADVSKTSGPLIVARLEGVPYRLEIDCTMLPCDARSEAAASLLTVAATVADEVDMGEAAADEMSKGGENIALLCAIEPERTGEE
jgi:hypothetical protein